MPFFLLVATFACNVHADFASVPEAYLLDDISPPAISLLQMDAVRFVRGVGSISEQNDSLPAPGVDAEDNESLVSYLDSMMELFTLPNSSVNMLVLLKTDTAKTSQPVVVTVIGICVFFIIVTSILLTMNAEGSDTLAVRRGRGGGAGPKRTRGQIYRPTGEYLLPGESPRPRQQSPPAVSSRRPGQLPPAHSTGSGIGNRPGSMRGRSAAGSVQTCLEPESRANAQEAGRRTSMGPGSADGLSDRGSVLSAGSPPGSDLQQYQRTMQDPAPMCGSLVLPHCEAWFAISWDHLMQNEFELYGLSGRPLLRAYVKRYPDLHEVKISMVPPKSPVLGSASFTGVRGDPFHVSGSTKMTYGTVMPLDEGRFSLLHTETNRELFTIVYMREEGHILLQSWDGTMVSAACRCCDSEFFTGTDHLEVRVYPGFDAVLALCCFLGIVVFGKIELTVGPSLGTPPEDAT